MMGPDTPGQVISGHIRPGQARPDVRCSCSHRYLCCRGIGEGDDEDGGGRDTRHRHHVLHARNERGRLAGASARHNQQGRMDVLRCCSALLRVEARVPCGWVCRRRRRRGSRWGCATAAPPAATAAPRGRLTIMRVGLDSGAMRRWCWCWLWCRQGAGDAQVPACMPGHRAACRMRPCARPCALAPPDTHMQTASWAGL